MARDFKELEDQGWNNMESILDQEMPVQKRKKRFFLWIFLLAGILGFSFYFLSKSMLNDKPLIALQSESLPEQDLVPLKNKEVVIASENEKPSTSQVKDKSPGPESISEEISVRNLNSSVSRVKVIDNKAKTEKPLPVKKDNFSENSVVQSKELRTKLDDINLMNSEDEVQDVVEVAEEGRSSNEVLEVENLPGEENETDVEEAELRALLNIEYLPQLPTSEIVAFERESLKEEGQGLKITPMQLDTDNSLAIYPYIEADYSRNNGVHLPGLGAGVGFGYGRLVVMLGGFISSSNQTVAVEGQAELIEDIANGASQDLWTTIDYNYSENLNIRNIGYSFTGGLALNKSIRTFVGYRYLKRVIEFNPDVNYSLESSVESFSSLDIIPRVVGFEESAHQAMLGLSYSPNRLLEFYVMKDFQLRQSDLDEDALDASVDETNSGPRFTLDGNIIRALHNNTINLNQEVDVNPLSNLRVGLRLNF